MPQANGEHLPTTFIFDEQFALCCDDRAKYQDTQGQAKKTPCTGVVAKADGASVEAATLAPVANSSKEHVVLRMLVDYQQKPGMAELGEPLPKVVFGTTSSFL
ncbi:hypothetical protein N7447_000332 [Penicillium robsamsonii]|uniref:uncharacterized protein n=1 Tax=Penicillium robsamsonii TaxID=1792511 RepID=UPI00254739CE|nr:uncharacterized protein N7447_000332 [Penicillium robsamsonii]KAJ5834306.1 hypothetical protein N7447_000332 [Penicillium robsamsonii]